MRFYLVTGGLSTLCAVGKGPGEGGLGSTGRMQQGQTEVPGQQKGVDSDRAALETGRKGASGCGRGQPAVCQQKSRERSQHSIATILLFPVVSGTLSCP